MRKRTHLTILKIRPGKRNKSLKMIKRHNLQPEGICEIGCGAGEILRQLQNNISTQTLFYGYDISPNAKEFWKERENETLKFFHQDLLSIQTGIFDLLLCIDVIEHVEDYMMFLRALQKKATYKLFHIPLEMSVLNVIRHHNLSVSRTKAGHLHYFLRKLPILTLEDTGYKIIDWFYTPFGIEKALTLKAKLLKLPRHLISLINLDFSVRLIGGQSLLVLAQ